MNPRQRRAALLMAVAVLGVGAVLLSLARYVNDVESQLGPMATVLRASEDIAPFTPVTAAAVESFEVPERWLSEAALRDLVDAQGLVTATSVPAGAILQEGMFVARPSIELEQREIAILVDAETGVAGKIAPGDVVDIVATFPGTETTPPVARVAIAAARIVEVGQVTAEDDEGFASGEVVPVTFALSVEESLELAFVESFATSVRLALRAPGDDVDLTPAERTYAPSTRSTTDG